MTKPATPLVLTRCEECHLSFLPCDAPCPKCGSSRTAPYPVPDVGRVIAATELTSVPPGWTAPHRLALLEVADGVRVLAIAPGALPEVGSTVRVRLDGEVYRIHPATPAAGGRGEGDFPRTRAPGSSFEPPR